ncbi:hypothetical protein LCGC14_2336010 [marine sediment metagenome]|uniref:Uncharacterized protein n=1 Tax=marine sediment metagenome TaxID=412755 RepID=A0A0F9ER89_9ZZZZ
MNGPMMAAMMGIGGVLVLLGIAVLVLSVLALVKYLRRPA